MGRFPPPLCAGLRLHTRAPKAVPGVDSQEGTLRGRRREGVCWGALGTDVTRFKFVWKGRGAQALISHFGHVENNGS